MATQHLDEEVNEVITKYQTPQNLAMTSAFILGHYKGMNLKILDLKNKSSLADYFVLASASNIVQAQAMVSEIRRQLKRHDHQNISQEGPDNSNWILLDLGDVLVHIFQETARSIYDLDRLWQDAPTVPIPTSFYSPHIPEAQSKAKSLQAGSTSTENPDDTKNPDDEDLY